MRRKNEKSKSQATPDKTTTRRISRRGKKSPSKSPESEHEETIHEEVQPVASKDSSSDSDSDNEPVIKSTRKTSRFDTDSKGRVARGRRDKKSESGDQENGNKDVSEDTSTKSNSRRKRDTKSENVEIISEIPKNSNDETVTKDDQQTNEKINDGIEENIDKNSPPEKQDIEINDDKSSSTTNTLSSVQSPSPSREVLTETSKEPTLIKSPPSQEPPEEYHRKNSRDLDLIEHHDQHSDSEHNLERPNTSPDPSEHIKRIQESDFEIKHNNEKENSSIIDDHLTIEKSPEKRRPKEKDEYLEKDNNKGKITVVTEPKDKTIDENESVKCTAATTHKRRKWTSRKISDVKPIIAISTDSLKNLISDVKPVPLSDVKLDSSPEPIYDDEPPLLERQFSNKSAIRERRRSSSTREESIQIEVTEVGGVSVRSSKDVEPNTKVRKVSAKTEEHLSPPKHIASNILYITNLVRPFTLLQLKGLLARTGKIVENGFWIDKIKSRCYVKYESEE